MKSITKMLLISGGGIVVLMVVGMAVSFFLGKTPEQIKEYDLIQDWLIYRIIFYLLIVILWGKISVWIARYVLRGEENNNLEKEEGISAAVFKKRWHVLALFVFFELVIVQQAGLAHGS